MSIEGERLVFDYLSRVGDLAHGTSMSAAERAALVGKLREEIGQRRAAAGGAESRSEVRRILGKIGSPEDVVARAAEAGGHNAAVPAPRPAHTPAPAADAPPADGPGPAVPLPAAEPSADGPPVPDATGGPDDGLPGQPEHPDTRYWPDGDIGGFTGGIEIPEMLGPARERGGSAGGISLDKDLPRQRPAEEKPAAPDDASDDGETVGPAPVEQAPGAAAAGGTARTLGKRLRTTLSVRRTGGFFEFAAVVFLLAGAVVPSFYAMLAGWLLSYWSPRLSRREAQWATFGAPAVVLAAYFGWIAGRDQGYWGAPLPEGAAGESFHSDWPWLLRGAALASAVLLFLRARRPRKADG